MCSGKGTYIEGRFCKKCKKNCLTCKPSEPDFCTSCYEFYNLDKEKGVCFEAKCDLSLNNYLNEKDGSCE